MSRFGPDEQIWAESARGSRIYRKLGKAQEVNSTEQRPPAASLGNPRVTEAEATLTHLLPLGT